MRAIKTKDFLLKFDKAINHSRKIHDADRALFILLSKYKSELPDEIDDIEWFHKMFRVTDVIEEAGINTAIWHLIGDSEVFFVVYEIMRNKK